MKVTEREKEREGEGGREREREREREGGRERERGREREEKALNSGCTAQSEKSQILGFFFFLSLSLSHSHCLSVVFLLLFFLGGCSLLLLISCLLWDMWVT